jgi:hypothetical protein
MSTNRDIDCTEALRKELVQGIVDDLGVPEALALPYANSVLAYLQREYPSQKLYIPAPPRQYDVLQIKAALEGGASIIRVCRDFGLSRTVLYQLFPGGIPRAQDVAITERTSGC